MRCLLVVFSSLLLFISSCGYFNKKSLRISLRFSNTGSLGPQEIRDLVNKRVMMVFGLEEGDIKPGKFSVEGYTFTVNGLSGQTDTEQEIINLFRGHKGVSFWETYRMEQAYEWVYKLNDTLISVLGLDTIKDTLYESEFRNKERKYPLFSVIAPAFDPNSPESYFSATQMVCRLNDTAAALKLMAVGFEKKIFPPDLKLMWGVKPDRYSGNMALFFLKGNNGPRPRLEPGQMLSVEKEKNEYGSSYSISFTMNEKDASKWKVITASNAPKGGMPGNSIVISTGGYAVSAPVVQSEIMNGLCVISGDFTSHQADDLVNVLKSSPLPFEVKVVNVEEVK
jgi:hypothetical protein